MNTPNVVQMTCPFCKREFPFHFGEVDRRIEELQQQRLAAVQKLHEINKRDYQRRSGRERKTVILELDKIDIELRKQKAIRKTAAMNHDRAVFDNFKMAVWELCGEEEFRKLIDYAEKETKAYEIALTANRPYQRARYKHQVTSVSKL